MRILFLLWALIFPNSAIAGSLGLHAFAPPQVSAYTTQIASLQGDIVQTWYKAQVSAFAIRLTRDNLINKFDAIYLLGGPDETASLVNFTAPALHSLGVNGTGLLWYQWQGFNGDGATAYLHMSDSMASMTSFTRNDAHMTVCALTNTAGSLESDVGTASSTAITFTPSDASGNQNAQLNSTTPLNSGTGATGIMSIDRPSSSVVDVYTNGVHTGTSLSSTSVAVPAQTMDILRAQQTTYADNQVCLVAWGAHLSAADETNWYADAIGFLKGSFTYNVPSDDIDGTVYFTRSMNSGISPNGFIIWCLCSSPGSNSDSSFCCYPVTVFGPLDVSPMATTTYNLAGTYAGHEVIANRCDACATGGNTHPNRMIPALSISGTTAGMSFTTIAKGDACTQSMVAYSSGHAANESPDSITGVRYGYNDILTTAGMPNALLYADVAASPATYFTSVSSPDGWDVTVDKCIEPKGRLADVTALTEKYIQIDYEVQDNHSGAQAIALAQALGGIVHAKSLLLSYITNSLIQAVAAENGLDNTSIDSFCAAFDYCGILVTDFNLDNPYTVTHSLLSQEALWTSPPYTKFIVDYGVGNGPQGLNTGGTTIADAQTMRYYIVQQNLAGFMIFATKGGTVRGGPACRPTNQIIAIMAGMTRCALGS